MNKIFFSTLVFLILTTTACAAQETPPQDSTTPTESQIEDNALTDEIVEEYSSIALKSLGANRDAVEELLRVSDCGTTIKEDENWNEFVSDYLEGWSEIAEEEVRSRIADNLGTPSSRFPGESLETAFDEIADAAPDRTADILEQWGCSEARKTSKEIAEIIRKSAVCISLDYDPFIQCEPHR